MINANQCIEGRYNYIHTPGDPDRHHLPCTCYPMSRARSEHRVLVTEELAHVCLVENDDS